MARLGKSREGSFPFLCISWKYSVRADKKACGTFII